MADYITLMGAEQVQSAANTMRHAADTMSGAANNMDSALYRHQMFMDDWLQRLQQVIESINTHQVTVEPPVTALDFAEVEPAPQRPPYTRCPRATQGDDSPTPPECTGSWLSCKSVKCISDEIPF